MSRISSLISSNGLRMSVIGILLLALGLSGGYWWANSQHGSNDMRADEGGQGMAADTGKDDVLYWYDPMVPDQHFENPGKSPFMDMQLVPKYASDTLAGGVRIEPGLQQSLGLRTAVVTTGQLASSQRVPGTLAWDLRRETVVSAQVSGQIKRLHIKAPYTAVRRGQTLATLLAPSWASAAAEAEALRQLQSPLAEELQTAARQRLQVLGATGSALADGSVTLDAAADGIVSEVLVREGQAVMAGTPLFRINGLDTLWLQAAIPQADAARLHAGMPVQATVDALPGRRFEGNIEALLPQVDTLNRTQQARIVLANPDHLLAPGMFAEVLLHSRSEQPRALIPSEALISTGTDSRVIVLADDGSLRPVRVRSGHASDGQTEILEGLQGGETVVTSGQFLIDSEASLSGLLSRLDGGEGITGNSAAADLHEAEATVKAIDGGHITLQHGPFESLHMPAMTMAFPLANPQLADDIKAGERVRVGVRSDKDGLTVERLEASGEQP